MSQLTPALLIVMVEHERIMDPVALSQRIDYVRPSCCQLIVDCPGRGKQCVSTVPSLLQMVKGKYIAEDVRMERLEQ